MNTQDVAFWTERQIQQMNECAEVRRKLRRDPMSLNRTDMAQLALMVDFLELTTNELANSLRDPEPKPKKFKLFRR